MKTQELSDIVAQHNALINASYYMEEIEARIFVAALRRVKIEDQKFNLVQIHKSEILPDMTGGKAYKLIDQASDRLLEKVIEIKLDDGYKLLDRLSGLLLKKKIELEDSEGFFKINLFSHCTYQKSTGFISLQFNNDVQAFLLNLKKTGNFTLLDAKYLLRLKKYHSFRIYGILKSRFYGDTVYFDEDIEELKNKLGIAGKYPNFSNFVIKVLKPAQEEIKKTDINFSFTEKRIGRSVKAIRFVKEDVFLPDENPGPLLPGILLPAELEKKLNDLGITSLEIIRRMVYENRITIEYIWYCIRLQRKGSVESLAGAIYKDIVERWKWKAYETSLKATKRVKQAVKAPESNSVKIRVSEAKEAFEVTRAAGRSDFDTWEEMLQKGFIEKGFSLVEIESQQWLIR